MLNSITIFLNSKDRPQLNMLPNGASGVFGRENNMCVVLLDAEKIRKEFDEKKNGLSHLFVDIDKYQRLAAKIVSIHTMPDLDMPIYSFSGNGHFDDLEVQQGGHRTFLLLESYGADYIPALVKESLVSKFRRLFGYEFGYLTRLTSGEKLTLQPLLTDRGWQIGTKDHMGKIIVESVELFNDKTQAYLAIENGNWTQHH